MVNLIIKRLAAVAAVSLLSAGCWAAARPAGPAHSTLDIAMSRGWCQRKFISENVQGLVSEADHVKGIEYRTFTLGGRLLSDLVIPAPAGERNVEMPSFCVESDGDVHVFWDDDGQLYGAIINKHGGFISPAKRSERVKVGFHFTPAVDGKHKCIDAFSDAYCPINAEVAPGTCFYCLNLDNTAASGGYDLPGGNPDIVFNGAFSFAVDDNGAIHLVYEELSKPGRWDSDLVVYYLDYDKCYGPGKTPQGERKEIARANARDCGPVGMALDPSGTVHCYYTMRNNGKAGGHKGPMELKSVDIKPTPPAPGKRLPIVLDTSHHTFIVDSKGHVRTMLK